MWSSSQQAVAVFTALWCTFLWLCLCLRPHCERTERENWKQWEFTQHSWDHNHILSYFLNFTAIKYMYKKYRNHKYTPRWIFWKWTYPCKQAPRPRNKALLYHSRSLNPSFHSYSPSVTTIMTSNTMDTFWLFLNNIEIELYDISSFPYVCEIYSCCIAFLYNCRFLKTFYCFIIFLCLNTSQFYFFKLFSRRWTFWFPV